MSRYFDHDGVYDSKISDYLDTSTVVKRLNEADMTIETKQARIQEINDRYEELLVEKCNEYELTQAKEDIKMLEERNLCLFSLLYELLEKQGYKDVDSVIEQMTKMHHNKCSHWYKNNKSCDVLMKELVRLKKNWKNSKLQQQRLYSKLKQQLAEKDETIEDMKDNQKDLCLRCGGLTHIEYEQDKISFCIEQLEKVKEYWLKHEDVSYYIDNQIEELKKESVNATRKNSTK